jgi:hypothetical protein
MATELHEKNTGLLEKAVVMDVDEFRALIDAKMVEEMRRENLRAAGLMYLIPQYDNTIALLKGMIDKWANAEWVIK